MGRDCETPCDDHYRDSESENDAYLDTTMDAHFAMPDTVEDLDDLTRRPGVFPHGGRNPAGTPWLRWAAVAAVTAAGIATGATVAHVLLRRRRPKVDPALKRAADETVQSLGTGTDMMTLTDTAYRAARPDCPGRLDPDDPTHADCIRAWLQLRDLIAARLPPPAMPKPVPQSGLSETGPAADMRGWLESLTPTQRAELRESIGAEHYDPISRAANAGDDKAVVKSVLALKAAIEDLASDDPLAALRQYRRLKSSLGPKLDELLRLAQQYEPA